LGDFIFSRGGKGIAVSPVVIKDTGPVGTDTDTTSPTTDLPITVITNSKSDNDAIKALIALYAQAYNYRDAAALWKIWPTAPAVTKQHIEGAFHGAAAIKMTVESGIPDIAPNGATATVKGQFSQLYTPRNGTPQPRNDEIMFSLKKDHGVWTLADVK
jgi:ketosteroid isomerase-like protein